MHYPNFFSSSSHLMQPPSGGLLLTLTLMPKSKKTLETSLDLVLLFKTPVDTRVDDLVSHVEKKNK